VGLGTTRMNLSDVLSKADDVSKTLFLNADHVFRALPTVTVSQIPVLTAFLA
jgi:hypothetical protein